MVYVTTPNTPTSRSQKPEENQKVVIENPETGKAMCENSLHASYHTTQQHTPSTIGMRPIATRQARSSMPRSLDLTEVAICVM